MQVRAVRRDNSAKSDIPQASLVEQVKKILADIQQSLFDAAKQKRDACIQIVKTWDEFIDALGKKKMILAPWCDEEVEFPSPRTKVSFYFVHCFLKEVKLLWLSRR